MKGWQQWLDDAPDRIREVVENGPMPLKEYGSQKYARLDRVHGLIRFKGGDGRGRINVKKGSAAVIYFDPSFTDHEHTPIRVPAEIMEKHSKDNVIEVFNQL